MRLAFLLMKSGEREEATVLLTQVTAEEKDPEQLLKSIDSMLTQKNYENVLGITEKLVRDQPKNWELLYRNGVALASTKPDEAARQFNAILALNLKDDEESLSAKNQAKKNQMRSRSPAVAFRATNPFVHRSQYSWQVRQAVGLDRENYYYGGGMPQQQPFWSPHDFGTARMACIGWLNAFAKNKGKEDEFVKERQELAAKSTDTRTAIDSYYLASLRHNGKEQYEILKKLSKTPGADVGIKSMYLTSLSGRLGPDAVSVVNEETGQQEIKLEPLDKDELEHVLACYRDIGNTSDNVNYGETFLELVATELKRAGRTEEAEKMLQDRIDTAKSPIQIASVLPGTIQRGDYATAMKLLQRLTELKPETPAGPPGQGVNFNYAQYVSTPEYQSQILAQLMANRAQKKEYGDVLTLWDKYLELAGVRHDADKSNPATKKRNAANNPYGSPGYYQVWRGGNQQGEQLDFPTPNPIYDHASIQMLRQAFVVFKEADTVKDLVDHFQGKLKGETKSETRKLFWRLGLGYLHWWNDDKDDALAVLTEVSAAMPDSEEMTFELARLHEKRGDPQQALALIESLTPSDQQTMQKREIAALRMSVNSGNIERARIAAERLFGLRLDSNLQIQLARQMHQLAMHEQAEAVLARAGRQAGNKTDVLMNLMQQYQSQGKNDVATQIAHQLLRRSTNSSAQYAMASMGIRSGRDDGGARQQALQVMKRSGKLPDMIKKVEEQLTHSPKSQKLLETLIEYYTADGNDKKVAELSEKYAETKGDDPQFRYQLAMRLVQSGKHKESLEHFKAALKKEPRLLRNSYWEIQNAFENADKLDDLANLYEEIDLKSFRQSVYELTNLISNMSRRDKTKDRSVALFKKAWQELPDQRSQLLSSLNSDVFWKLPEIYDYARQGIIPTESSLQQTGRWAGFGNIQSWDNEGKMTTLLSRFLTLATQQKKLDAFAAEVEQAQQKLKNWQAGEPLLALVNLRRGKVEESRAVFEKLLPTLKGVRNAGYYTHWEIAQELMAHESCVDLAIKYLETAIKEPELMSGNEFQYTPGKALVVLYKQRGRKEDARRVILQAMTVKSEQNYGNRQYEAYRRIRNSISLGNEIRNLGFPVDSVRIFQEALAKTDDIATAQNWGGDVKRELQTGFQASLAALKPEALPELLMGSPDANGKPATSVDLVLLIDSRELDKTTMTSALVKLVSELVNKPEMVAKTTQALSDVRTKRPDDLSTMILATELAIATKDDKSTSALVKQLVELIEKSPLEPQPVKGGFTSAQRETAKRQIALWLIARRCLKQESLRGDGDRLAERALEASRRSIDNGYTLAILREWGQIALETGDKATAEKRWTDMLDVVIPKPVEKPKKKDDGKTSMVPASTGTSTVLRPLTRSELMFAPALAGQAATGVFGSISAAPGRPPSSKGNAVTLEQFLQAAQLAKMAAQNDLPDLSLQAIAQALHAGPPVEAIREEVMASGFPTVVQNLANDQSNITLRVEEQLTLLQHLWLKKKVDPVRIYELLKRTVLPERRPLEVFLYPRPLSRTQQQPPQGVGLQLALAAVRADKVDDLRETLHPRLAQPLGEFPAKILSAQLAMASGDIDEIRKQIDLLTDRLKQDSLQYTNELACHVAVPAMTRPEVAPSAIALLEMAVEHFQQNGMQGRASLTEEPMRSYRFLLARRHLKHGNPDAGKQHLEQYLSYLIPLYKRYNVEAGQQRRKADLLKIAAEFARAGFRDEALRCLGEHVDLPTARNSSTEGAGRASAVILGILAQGSAADRYNLLKAWTLPTPDRRSARVFAGLIPADRAPARFDAVRQGIPRGPQMAELQSTAQLLIDAASQAGKLDELRRELQPHADQDVENTKVLLLMTRIALQDATVVPALTQYIDERVAALPKQGEYAKRPLLLDPVLAKAAIKTPGFIAPGRRLSLNFFTHCTRVQEHLLMTLMRHDYNASVLGPETAGWMDFNPSQPGLMHWTAGSTTPALYEARGAMPMWWQVHDDLITHICGPNLSQLYLKYPLTGTFEISCDGWMGPWAESNVGFGGLAYAGQNNYPPGNQADAIHKADPPERAEHFNRLTLNVEPGGIQYLVNGTPIHKESSDSSTSPWFFLNCGRAWQTGLRNFQITGQPVVPRELTLASKESLLGWSADFYNEIQPAQRQASAPSALPSIMPAGSGGMPWTDYDWWCTDGVIHGRMLPLKGFGERPVQQSRLYYGRPLQDGERLHYEFWYETGDDSCHVHPALDRLALLLEPDGVKEHWMTDGDILDDGYTGLASENAIVDESSLRNKVTLNPQAWNGVDIELRDGTVQVSLNGSVVCVRPLDPGNSRQFGFYHDKSATAVRVRNVTLTGDWPKSVSPELVASLTAPSKERTPAERRVFSGIVEEKYAASELDSLLLRTRSLPLAARYEALKTWVLPNDDHSALRLYADMTPMEVLPNSPIEISTVTLVESRAPATPVAPTFRARTGGDLIAPALDLVSVAAQLGKLDELAETVKQIPVSNDGVRRSRLAMLTLISIAKSDFKQAEAAMKELTPGRSPGLPDSLTLVERWPELVVAWEAARIPELRAPTSALLDVLVDSVNRKGIGWGWDIKVRALRHHALALAKHGRLPAASARSPKGQWAQSTQTRSATRANGIVGRWQIEGHESLHLGGDGNDMLYFQSPLRGNFTVLGEVSTFGWREARLMYAGQWAGPQYSLDVASVGNLNTEWSTPKFPTKLDPLGDWCQLKMEITDDSVRYFVNDRQIHEQHLAPEHDPWLAIQCAGQSAAATRSVRIMGQPVIPAELQLSRRDDLQGWWADMYGDPMNDNEPAWKKQQDEIVGRRIEAQAGRAKESLLQYHRPMLEDGVITYEFFYVPSQTLVHPALGRLALILDPEGVKIHWLTDGPYERTGWKSDNISIELEHRKGPAKLPLKAGDWNAVSLSLKGDVLTLSLNGADVYERPVDSGNQRTFGLFHYAGETDVRVRNVRYRGNWPQSLPSIRDQELASDDVELATFQPDELPASYSWNFQGPTPAHLSPSGVVPTNSRSQEQDGLRIVRTANVDPQSQQAGIQWSQVSIGGDFEVTFGYRDFQSKTTVTTHQVPRAEIILALGGGFGQHTQTLALTHRRQADNSMILTSILGTRRNPPDEEWQSSDVSLKMDTHRLRIVRRNNVAYYLKANPGTEEWQVVDRRSVTGADVKDLLIGLRSEDPQGTATAVLTEFSVRARKIDYVPRFADEELPGRFVWRLQDPQPKGIQAWASEAPNKFEPVAEGIRINRPLDPKQKASAVGFNWLGRMRGDFEVTLDYHDFQSESDRNDWSAPRIEIHMPIGGPDGSPSNTHTATVGHRRRKDAIAHSSGVGLRQPDGQKAWKTTERKTDASSGRLRLIRVGSMIHALVAPLGTNNFTVIGSQLGSAADVNSVSFTIRSESKNSWAMATFSNITIRASELEAHAVAATDAPIPPKPFADGALPDVIRWNFQGKRPDALNDWGTYTLNSVTPDRDGMKISRAARVTNSEQTVGYALSGLSGDFEVTLDYRDFKSTPVLTDWRVPRVDISASIHSAADPSMSIQSAGVAARRNHGGEMKLLATQGEKGADGKYSYKTAESPTERDGGRLRMVRQGSMMFYQAAATGSEKWETISSLPVDPGPITFLSLGLRAEDLEAGAEAVLTNVTIRAKHLDLK